MTFVHRFRALLRGALPLLAALSVAPAFSADCPPDSAPLDAPKPAYEGRSPIGERGDWIRVPDWFREVRRIRTADGGARYAFRGRPGELYDSIEPVLPDDGPVLAFAARRGGCTALFGRHGRPLPLPTFREYREDVVGAAAGEQRTRVLRLVLTQASTDGEERVRYALVRADGTTAVSPHAYLMSYEAPDIGLSGPSGMFREVSTAFTDAKGVLRLDTLQEVVPPTLHAVGEVLFDGRDGRPPRRWFVADDGRAERLLTADGRPVELPADFQRVVVRRGVLPADASRDGDYLELDDFAHRACRLLRPDLRPLLDVALPLVHDRCPDLPRTVGEWLPVGDGDASSRLYRLAPGPAFEFVGMIPGVVVHTFLAGRTLVREPGAGTYRVFGPDGRPIDDEAYDEVRELGCGFVDVRRGTSWWSMRRDGARSDRRFVPFSC